MQVGIAGLFVAAIALAAIIAQPYAILAAGYKGKNLCSEVFVAGRAPKAVRDADFTPVNQVFALVTTKINHENKTVDSALFGLGRTHAIYRPGYGCTLAIDGAPDPLPSLASVRPKPWPLAEPALHNALKPEIDALIQKANADPNTGHRAVAVFVDSALAYEWYADGFSADTRFVSWSMAKSITAAMVGVAVRDGLVDVAAPAPIEAWKDRDDARGAITWTHLLQMTSGLQFDETYDDPHAAATKMLFHSRRMADIAAAAPLQHQPGSHWSYSSGTTNILQRALRRIIEESGGDYHAFPRNQIFAPLGVSSAVFETDAAGDFVGSSYLYATARDWGKLGQLHLQDGVWDGERILPEGWTQFVAEPTAVSDQRYGAQFWLNKQGLSGRNKPMPSIPDTAYRMAGHYGQYVLIAPSLNTVIVRLGFTPQGDPNDLSDPFLEKIYNVVDRAKQ